MTNHDVIYEAMVEKATLAFAVRELLGMDQTGRDHD